MNERCEICGCAIHRTGDYAKPTVRGRSHATRHHHVAERFFGRSANRRGTIREPVFAECPWAAEHTTSTFCYECHEELIHNPVFLPEDIQRFAEIVKVHGLDEQEKTDDRSSHAGRIKLLHEIIETGLRQVAKQTPAPDNKRLRNASAATPSPPLVSPPSPLAGACTARRGRGFRRVGG